MSERRTSRMRWAIAGGLTWLGLIGLAFGLWYADEIGAFRNCYLKIHTPSGPRTWVQFKGNRLRTASSSGALARSPWVRAKVAGWEHTEFAALALGNRDDLRATFSLSGTQCDIKWEVAKRDLDGARWTYVVEDAAEAQDSLDACPEIAAPNLHQLALAVETQPEREGDDLKLGIGLRVTGAHQREVQVTDIRKEGKNVPALIEVKNDARRTVLTEQQPLSKLGFT